MNILADKEGFFVSIGESTSLASLAKDYGPFKGLATIPDVGIVLARVDNPNMERENPKNGDCYYVFTDKAFEIIQFTSKDRRLNMPLKNVMLAQLGHRVAEGTNWDKLAARHSDGRRYTESDMLTPEVSVSITGNVGKAKLVILRMCWGTDTIYQVTDSEGRMCSAMFRGSLAIQGNTLVIHRESSINGYDRLEVISTDTKDVLITCPGDDILPIAYGYYLVYNQEKSRYSIWYDDKTVGSRQVVASECATCTAGANHTVIGYDEAGEYLYSIQLGPNGIRAMHQPY